MATDQGCKVYSVDGASFLQATKVKHFQKEISVKEIVDE